MPDVIRAVWIAVLALAILATAAYGVMLMRATRARRARPVWAPPLSLDTERAKHAAEALSAAVKLKTVSHEDPLENENAEWVKLRDQLRRNFPKVHKALTREIIGDYSLLFIWKADEPCGKPVLLCGHLDVAPADGEWEHPPFAGVIDDGYVWGRGALDCKNNVIAMLEAVETLLARGAKPSRDIYLAFNHDQESGVSGANALSRWFAERDLSFYMVLDEGGWLTRGTLPIRTPVAQVGVAEKGRMLVKLSVDTRGGHSSSPPAHSAIGILAEAIARMEYKPRRAKLTPVVLDQLKSVCPDLPFRWRFALVNMPFTTGNVIKLCSKDVMLDALVRTTIAVTRVSGGSSANVLPHTAQARLDVRLLHGDDGESVLRFIMDMVQDLGVSVERIECNPPSPVSEHKCEQFSLIKSCVHDVFGKVRVVPALVTSSKSARQYERFCDHIYRFSPFALTPLDQNRIHGVDEGVRVDSLGLAVSFYRELLLKFSAFAIEDEHMQLDIGGYE